MTTRVLLHSSRRDLAVGIGRAVAERLSLEFADWFGLGREGIWDKVGGQGSGVSVVPSDVLLDRERRVETLARSTVVGIDPGVPCQASGQSELERTLEALAAAEFRESHAVFADAGRRESEVVREICDIVARRTVVVAARERSYLVEIGQGIVESGLSRMRFGAPVMLYLTDENVERHHGQRLAAAVDATGLRSVRHVLVPGEERKCLSTLGEIFNSALAGGIDRSCWVVAAGGGVTTDIGGLVAALWMRGLRWVALPTTLLSMVDASVGGKTAVDFGVGKNAVGAFWQPSAVMCDVEFLRTESDRNYIGALSEVVKTALIGDRALFELLEKEGDRVIARDLGLMVEVVRRCVQVKARIVGLDEMESGLRAVLNLGHTVGHALEALGEYRRYTHGEAVSLGLVVALRLGRKLGYTSEGVVVRVESLLRRLGLPVEVDGPELLAASELLGHDKKRSGSSIRFVFVREVGDVQSERVGLEDLRELVGGLV